MIKYTAWWFSATLSLCVMELLATEYKLYMDIWRFHDEAMKWKRLLHYWPFVRGIHHGPHKKFQECGALVFFMLSRSICSTNCRVAVIWDAKMLIQRACNAFTVCSMFGSNPVVPTYCELDPQKQIPSKFESKYNNFIHKNVWELSSPKCRPCFSLRSGARHIRLSTGQSMVQLMVCRLRDAKPLSEIRLVYC